MNHFHHDEHVARLQRLAYGADSTPEERGTAVDELQALAVAAAAGDASAGVSSAVADPVGGTGASPRSGPGLPGAGASNDSPVLVDERAEARRLAVRIGVIAGAAALVLGLVAGLQIAQLSAASASDAPPAAPNASPGPRLQADVLAAMPVAADTLAARVFLRPAVAEDTPSIPGLLDGGGMTPGDGPVEFRLLATRSDGTQFFAVRDGVDLCFFITFTVESASGTCTDGGRFPDEGLQLGASAGNGRDAVDATWHPDGSLRIGMLSGAPPTQR